MASKGAKMLAVLLLLVLAVAVVLAIVFRDEWLPWLRDQLGVSATAAASPGPAASPTERWGQWQPVAGKRCVLVEDTDDFRKVVPLPQGLSQALASEDLRGKPSCRPVGSSVPRRLVFLETRSSDAGKDQLRFVDCEDPDSLPECCVADRSGLNVSATVAAAAGFENKNQAFRALCEARFGCPTDRVYTGETPLVPWIPGFPLDCFSDANVNTCAYMVLEQSNPGTYSPNPEVVTDATRDALQMMCSNDTRRAPSSITPGPSMPRITAADLRADCEAAGARVPDETACG
jgi:hypothetical protein